MRPRVPVFWTSFPKQAKNSILVTVFGVIGLLTIMLWTGHVIRKHVGIASLSVFPAALESQRAGTAFERMNREYSDSVEMQEKTALSNADREAAIVVSSLDSARISMRFNPLRHQQIVRLQNRVTSLQQKTTIAYSAATEAGAVMPKKEDLANLSQENEAVKAALKILQGDLTNDFRAELALVDTLLNLQGILEALLLIGLIVALTSSIRSLIEFIAKKREDEISQQTHKVREKERSILRALIDNIPDFMYVKDVESRFVVANVHLARVVGAKTPEEMTGKTDFDYYPPELARAFYEDDQNVIRSGQPLCSREETGIDDAGNETHVLTTKVPTFDSDGRVTGIAGVGHDIGGRKKMENALREAEQKYRGIFDNAIVGIFQCTPGGRFLSLNPSLAFTAGYDSPEDMTSSITDIARQFYADPKRREEFVLLMDKVGSVTNFDCEIFRKDGSKTWVAMSVRAIRQNGAVVRYEGMCEDITERNLLRQQLFQAQKLESVGQLAAGIAHEINTPTQYIGDNVRFLKDAFQDLASLLSSYERLLLAAKDSTLSGITIQEVSDAVDRTDAGYLLEEIPKAIGQTLEGVSRVSTLVGAMKEFSHPGTKDKVPLDVNHAISCTITVARNEWKYVAELETDFDPSLPPVACLPGEFNQVILNLIVNAAHAIAGVLPQDESGLGKITVRTRNFPDWAEIRIQDTGSGIPKDVQPRIFDPFFTTKAIGKGTGQGLAIARSVVVDKHGGSINFETEQGKGTTFIIRLPYNGTIPAVTAAVA